MSKLSEYSGKAVIVDVAVRLYSHIQDVDRLVQDTLGLKCGIALSS